MTVLASTSAKAMRSLTFKTLLALAAAALPALAVATALGMTLITVVGGAKQEFERATSTARRIADIRVLAEREYGLVSRIPAELDLGRIRQYAQQINDIGYIIDGEV